MSEFNFKSQICTDREQSERLLALGLKKETADCGHFYGRDECSEYSYWSTEILDGNWKSYWDVTDEEIPAWSLHRLIELAYGNWKEDIVPIYLGNSYDMLIGRIEFQVKQGKFNKEYLV